MSHIFEDKSQLWNTDKKNTLAVFTYNDSRDAVDKKANIAPERNYNHKIDKWFHCSNGNKTYGPKKLLNNLISLGDKEVEFIKNNVNIKDKSYPLTPGLVRLLFLKHPLTYSEPFVEITYV